MSAVALPGSRDHVTVLHGPVVLARDRRIARTESEGLFLKRPVPIQTTGGGIYGCWIARRSAGE